VDAPEPSLSAVDAPEPSLSAVDAPEPSLSAVDAPEPSLSAVDAPEPSLSAVDAPEPSLSARPALLLATALCAFAANSLLCRAALETGAIDAASFTGVRLASGAVVVSLFVRARGEQIGSGGARAGLALCAYAVAFSLAYLRIPAGTGALILFGAVQVTMVGSGLARGERLLPRQWAGMLLALAGLCALLRPGQAAPDLRGAALMATAGVAWGVYSLLGRGSARPLAATAHNFLWSVPLVALFVFVERDHLHASPRGVVLAVASGAIASGLGYAIWYAALRHVSASRAAIAQLIVPVLAALGGVLVLREAPSARLFVCGAVVLCGVAIAIAPRAAANPARG